LEDRQLKQKGRRRKVQSSLLFRKSLQYAIGFNAVWIVYLGAKHGLFRSLASCHHPISPTTLAKRMHLYVPAVRAWCSSAVCLGYLSENNNKDRKVMLPALVKDFVLREQSPYFVAGQFTYSALRSLEYDSFDELFLSGRAKPPSSPNTIKAFEQVTSWDHYAAINAIKESNKKLHKLLLKGCAVLDVGCGAGRFMQRMAAVYPKSEFTGIDPFADEIKKKRVKEKEENRSKLWQNEKISIQKGSGETMDFQEEFDLVYLGESLYLMDDKQRALRNCYNALRKGGTIAILEGLLQDDDNNDNRSRISDENKKLVLTMQLDFVLQGHEFLTKKQLINLLKKEAKFNNIKFCNLGVSFYLITAEK
jgi:ubiquinone/menaquinone biosynthesis C-methylase UbiE